ncbi:Methyltransferase domain-containing protein [Persephonella hydrogeniphila]|uniref:Methyltransferase domain-containing protein n=1 Tax=Persephonella hydrogeniphila TaxID=198703 RepID=A0A285N189_9AQUI|nr:class I SAM-dependent methyltransferase [Persephonella hydrogeniphila]SNZ03200.1 Methyltransferase domain-containing protein [Persephonella hydrogeniphila]
MDIGKRFDKVADRYDTSDKIERSKSFVQDLLKILPINKSFKVLDIGAGTGNVDVFLSPYVKEIVALDLSEGMLDVFRKKIKDKGIKNIRIYKKDLFSEDLQEKDFDLIITSMTFHHLDNPEESLKHLKKYLKKGGYIAVIDLYKEDGTFHSDNTDVKHFGFDEKDIEKWLETSGLEKVDYRIVYSIKKEREGKIREYPVFLIIAIKK